MDNVRNDVYAVSSIILYRRVWISWSHLRLVIDYFFLPISRIIKVFITILVFPVFAVNVCN